MPDVLLFGATGYTGRLTAEALGRRAASFVVAGRDLAKLEELAERTGATDARRAEVGDVAALTRALEDVKAIISCVGPFRQLGDTAAEAAVRAGVHYVDSTGELGFIDHLIENYGPRAETAGIVMAPSMGFDEVPADVALSLAVEGLDRPEAVVTYALPTHASTGTLRTLVAGIATSDARWVRAGRPEKVATGSRRRWAPMPPPLGPKLGVSVPLAEGRLAPLHLELSSLELYMTAGTVQAAAMRAGMPVVKLALRVPGARKILDKALDLRSSGPDGATRATDRWTILAEARDESGWRNVALQGSDPYGLTGETLAAGGLKMAHDGHDDAGVMAPVQAMGLEGLQKVLIDLGVDVRTYEPAG
jgi:short subunit dehydrogenase-like uncharacterized protein